eukprot:jgi/Ulvmu1/7509/UM037_0053.1
MQYSSCQQLRSDVRGLGHCGLSNRPHRRSGPLTPRSLPTDIAEAVVQHAPLAYERVVGACSSMNCGDILHRSTLDPALRMEEDGISPVVAVVALIMLAYTTATPGPLQGALDTYVIAPLKQLTEPTLKPENVQVGRKLAEGGFGTVYLGTAGATIPGKIRKGEKIIIKKADEFGEAEVWMNERLARAAPQSCATFLTAYPDGPPQVGTPLALVWKFEGKNSLSDVMQSRDFPLNVEKEIMGRELRIQDPATRKMASVKVIMQQMLKNLGDIHRTGIVHRDVKPQNMILADNGIRMIDLGAAADLRIGINYVPNEYLLDPRFAPPEQYIMSPLTPRAPPTPVAALLSPVLWRLNQPDRFDVYSAGIVMMQLVFPSLRSDSGIIAFRSKLEDCEHDLQRWRSTIDNKNSPYSEGLSALDANGGAGWQFISKMLAKKPSDRMSARQALNHSWLKGSRPESAADIVASKVESTLNEAVDILSSVGPRGRGNSLSEAELYSALNKEDEEDNRPIPRNMPRTIAWWQDRARNQKANSNVFARMFKQSQEPKQNKVRGKSGIKGGFATQRAYGIASPKASREDGGKVDIEDASQEEEKRPALSGLLSKLNKD